VKKPKIYFCTKGSDPREFKTVAMRSERLLSLDEMVDGLCSKYWRDRYDGDDGVPDSLSLPEVWETVRGEYDRHGSANTWTWSDACLYASAEEARKWARDIILTVIPELKEEGS
jgi:hypothetical protein